MSRSNNQIFQNNILLLIRQKKEEGMQQLFNLYFDELFRYCYNLTNNKEDSEDILQTIFLDLWKNSSNREINNLKSYLFQMLKYQVYSYWANKKDITELVEDYNEILSTDEVNQFIEITELEETITLAVSSLPPACKNVFELSKIDGLSHDEIAIKMNISKQTVKNQLSKAIKHIKKIITTKY